MLKKDPNYRRLKLGGRGSFNSSSYWLGPDHLFVVEVSNYTERYRRFYFRDLQAVIVQQTNTRLVWNIVLVALPVFALAIFSLASGGNVSSSGMLVFFGIVLGIFGLLLLIHNRRGPTCSVHLRTAVQTQKLSNINRWRQADRLIAELTPLIQAAPTAPTPTAPAEESYAPPAGNP